MNEEQWDGKLADVARTYHEPTTTPRDAMWEAIQAARRNPGQAGGAVDQSPVQRALRRFARPSVRWVAWGAGIAALIALGIGIGRMTASHEGAGSTGTLATVHHRSETGSVAVDLAATQHLTQAEAFLTGFRAEVKDGRSISDFSTSARGLLTTTRLLLDSPDLTDPRTRGLLEELEFVLAQIGQLQTSNGMSERDLITDELKQRGLMPRLRSAIPAGAAAPGAQGEL